VSFFSNRGLTKKVFLNRNRMENSKTAIAVYREKPHDFLIYLNFSLGLLSMENSMNVFVLASILLLA